MAIAYESTEKRTVYTPPANFDVIREYHIKKRYCTECDGDLWFSRNSVNPVGEVEARVNFLILAYQLDLAAGGRDYDEFVTLIAHYDIFVISKENET